MFGPLHSDWFQETPTQGRWNATFGAQRYLQQRSLWLQSSFLSRLKGAFHLTKNSGLKFRKLHVSNGTVNPEIFRLGTPARLDRTVPLSFGWKFPEIYDRGVRETEIFRME